MMAIFMTGLIFLLAGPYQAALAALIPTEVASDSAKVALARDNIKDFMARQDSQNLLIAKGISPEVLPSGLIRSNFPD
jgi:hypothetical protein